MGEALITRRGGGGVKFASGSFMLTSKSKTVDLDVGFDPSKICIYGDFPIGNIDGNTSSGYVLNITNTSANFSTYGNYIGYVLYNTNLSSSVATYITWPTITSSGGIVTVKLTYRWGKEDAYEYPAYFRHNVTYHWYAWVD